MANERATSAGQGAGECHCGAVEGRCVIDGPEALHAEQPAEEQGQEGQGRGKVGEPGSAECRDDRAGPRVADEGGDQAARLDNAQDRFRIRLGLKGLAGGHIVDAPTGKIDAQFIASMHRRHRFGAFQNGQADVSDAAAATMHTARPAISDRLMLVADIDRDYTVWESPG